MKRLLFLLLFFPTILKAQTAKDSAKWLRDTVVYAQIPRDQSTGLFAFKIIDAIKGASKKDLYSRAKIWATLAFKSVNNVIQMDDPDGGNFILKGVHKSSNSTSVLGIKQYFDYYLHFTLQFTVKDERYRLIISGISIETLPNQYSSGDTFTIESYMNELKDFNQNAKTGNMEFNRREGISKGDAKNKASYINEVYLVTTNMLADVREAMNKTVKSDDF